MAQGDTNLAKIRASGGSTRKTATSYAASQRALIKTIMEAGDAAHTSTMYSHYITHTSTMYGHYIRCLSGEVLVRIIDKHQETFRR